MMDLSLYADLVKSGEKITGKKMKEIMKRYNVKFKYANSSTALLESSIKDDEIYECTGWVCYSGVDGVCLELK